MMFVRDQPLPILVSQPNGQARAGLANFENGVGEGHPLASCDLQLRYVE